MKIEIKIDNKKIKAEKGISGEELIAKIDTKLAKNAIAMLVDGKAKELNEKISKNAEIKILTFEDKEGKEVLWHSASHIMASAVVELFPDAKPTIGPAIEQGFYYDFFREKPFDAEEIKQIEDRVSKILQSNVKFEKFYLDKKSALEKYADNKFKAELISELDGDKMQFYKNGKFEDLCRGPHILSSGKIKSFKIVKDSSAYWRGDSKNEQLRRLYGVAFPNKNELQEYLKYLEEIDKRDHRKLGKQLELFSIHDEAPGSPFILPKGMIIWNELLKLWKEKHKERNYKEIKTPVILNRNLWETSGHWENYRQNMYTLKIDDMDFAIKPMNCPGGFLVYKEKKHSYKELPLRVGEIGLVHRHELSGVLSGLFRVRPFHQDDAHIFMTPEQIESEVLGVLELVDEMYKIFGLSYHLELSTKPAKSIGTDEEWKTAEKALEDAMKKTGKEYKLNPGDGAFYGPKIDVHVKDAIGRTWQCGTIQLDMNMPRRFNLAYTGADNKEHMPVMVHRVIYGSLERFLGVIIEHFAGSFPTWLSPVQVRVLPISDKHVKYAEKVRKDLEKEDVRVEIDDSVSTVQYKIRDAQMEKVPYMLVLGDKEVKKKKITVRTRDGKVKYDQSFEKFKKDLIKEIKGRRLS